MDIELKKIKTPFSPNEQYFVDLASRIQKKVGIEVEEIRQESPKLDLNKKKVPLQLTVEFGYPLTAEKNVPEDSTHEMLEEVIDLVTESTIELIEIESTLESITPESLETVASMESIVPENIETVDSMHSGVLVVGEFNPSENSNEEPLQSGGMDISETMVSPYFSDADLDRLHEQMHLEQTKEKQKSPVEVQDSTQTILSKSKEVKSLEQEPLAKSPSAVDFENTFSDAELDMLHDMHTMQHASTTSQSIDSLSEDYHSTEQNTGVHAELASPQNKEKTIKIPVDTKVIDRENQAASIKPSLFDMIPWSTVFGLVASLMAVASAWFIWNSIQKPIAIDAMIDQAVVTTPAAVQTEENSEVIEEGIQIEELSPAQQVTYEWVGNQEDDKVLKTKKFDFKKLNEKSKVSSVELERNGLTVLELEDPIFDEVTL
jgi:hypothetical protein